MAPALVEEAAAALGEGRFVIVLGSRAGTQEGHLAIAAERATADAVNFMATHGRGVICIALTAERCDELDLPPMTSAEDNLYGSSVTVSIEAREGVSTGISAGDRARTIAVAADPSSTARDLVRPGHVFPVRTRSRGVLERAGRSEAAVDLARIAGLQPAAAVCEILDEAGGLAGEAALEVFSRNHGIAAVTIEAIVEWRWRSERLVERRAATRLPTEHGEFTAIAFVESSGASHVALVRGELAGGEDVPVHVHPECLEGDVFRSHSCRCAEELEAALRMLAAAPRGVLLYLTQKAVRESVRFGAEPTVPEAGVVAQILADLGLSSIRLLGGVPLEGVEAYGLRVVSHQPLS